MKSENKRKEFIEKYLIDNDNKLNNNPIDTLITFIEIIIISYNKKKLTDKPIVISKQSSLALQSLFIQCLHGSIPENIRDKGFFCLFVILSTNIIHNQWTIQDKSIDSNDFCILISSLINIELHLIFEELYTVYTDSEINLNDNALLNRKIRLHNMIIICLCLLDNILILLVDTSNSNNKSIWEDISNDSLVKIKQSIDTCIYQLCDFVKDSCDYIKDHDTNNEVIRFYIYRSIYSLCKWINEDENLFEPFVNIIPSIINICDCISCNTSDINDSSINNIVMKLTNQTHLYISNDNSITTCNYFNISNQLYDYFISFQLCPIHGDILLSIVPTVLLIYECIQPSDSLYENFISIPNYLTAVIKVSYVLTYYLSNYLTNKISNDIEMILYSAHILTDQINVIVSKHSNDLKGMIGSGYEEAIQSVLTINSNDFMKCINQIKQIVKNNNNDISEYMNQLIESSNSLIMLIDEIGLIN